MKQSKRIFSFLLCCVLIFSVSFPSFAKRNEEEEEDYSVSDVYFDISDTKVLVGWSDGESKTSYSVQLYKSPDFTAKNKIGGAATVPNGVELCDVTEKVLKKGSGTYYAQVMTKKRPKGGEPGKAYGKTTITSEDLSDLKKNRPLNDAKKETSQFQGAKTGTNGGPGTSSLFSGQGTPHWVALNDGKWSYQKEDGSTAVGWYLVNGKWYFSGEDGVMLASSWIRSATEEKVWYYVGTDGAMLTNATTPDHYTVDAEGKYREP